MSDLQNVTPANSYRDLFHLANNGNGLDSVLRQITGGDGTATPILVSQDSLQADMNGGLLSRPTIKDERKSLFYVDLISAFQTPIGTISIDAEAADVFYMIRDAEVTTFNITNLPTDGTPALGRWKEITIILELPNPLVGGLVPSFSWPASTLWPGGNAPVLSSSPSAIDVVKLVYVDNGSDTKIFGFPVALDLR